MQKLRVGAEGEAAVQQNSETVRNMIGAVVRRRNIVPFRYAEASESTRLTGEETVDLAGRTMARVRTCRLLEPSSGLYRRFVIPV